MRTKITITNQSNGDTVRIERYCDHDELVKECRKLMEVSGEDCGQFLVVEEHAVAPKIRKYLIEIRWGVVRVLKAKLKTQYVVGV